MVIKPLHAHIADGTVRSARRSIDVAGIAEFNFEVVGLDVEGKDFVHQWYFPDTFTYGNSSEFSGLVGREHLGYDAWVSASQFWQENLRDHIEEDANAEERVEEAELVLEDDGDSHRVVDNGSCPQQNVGENIIFKFRNEVATSLGVLFEVGSLADLVERHLFGTPRCF